MRKPTDFFGLLAYLTIMYGRLPDREMLNAAYTAMDEDERPRPRLELVPSPAAEPPHEDVAHTSAAA